MATPHPSPGLPPPAPPVPPAEAGDSGAQALWRFAVARYAQPGVAAACLEAQARFDADVPLLLWALWLAEERRQAVDAADAAAARALTRAWRADAILPLRRVRQALKAADGAPPPLDPRNPAVAAWREKVKALELEAEQLELAALASLIPAAPRPASGIADIAALAQANLAHFLPPEARAVTQALHLPRS